MDARLQLNRPVSFDPVIVGAPPQVVSAGLPGAREEVRAYGERIRAAWAAFWNTDVRPWAAGPLVVGTDPGDVATPGTTVLGDVIGSDPKAVAEHKVRLALFDKLRNDRAGLHGYLESIASFDPTGPNAAQAWQRLQVFEALLRQDRAELQSVAGVALKSDNPGPLEEPGGVVPKPVLTAVPWTGILLVGGALAVAWGMSSVVASRR